MMPTITRIHFIAPDGYLCIVMVSRLHEIAVIWVTTEVISWASDGLLTAETAMLISDGLSSISLCTAIWNYLVYTINCMVYNNFVCTFANLKRTPTLCLSPRVNGVMTNFPTIVLESGWSEAEAQLERDSQLCLEGSDAAVKVVILFKLFRPNVNNQIKATLHFCRLVNNEIVLDTIVCFPSLPYPSLSYILLINLLIF